MGYAKMQWYIWHNEIQDIPRAFPCTLKHQSYASPAVAMQWRQEPWQILWHWYWISPRQCISPNVIDKYTVLDLPEQDSRHPLRIRMYTSRGSNHACCILRNAKFVAGFWFPIQLILAVVEWFKALCRIVSNYLSQASYYEMRRGWNL